MEELEELPFPESFGQVCFVDVDDFDVDAVTVAGRLVVFDGGDACASPVNPV